ncbi:hypothetical protein [Gordonia sputi]|uniref:hypothetical protein n=1 Tax=Gordonia sputi TaxID=36823 RepID=UPI00226EF43D|nr:hypothetical protein [Gordonia sputi]
MWSSTADLNQRGEDDLARDVIDRARQPNTRSVVEVRLVTYDVRLSEQFWRAVWPDAATVRWTEFTHGHALEFLSIMPTAGPTLRFLEANGAPAITSVDLRVTTDVDAADRLREAGFEVSGDGTRAVDVNATDADIWLEVP